MYSKKTYLAPAFARTALVLLALLTAGFSQVVDCILAEVNGQIITLMDLRILKAFAIGPGGTGGDSASSPQEILDRAINQKILIGLGRENISVTKDEVNNQLKELLGRLKPEERTRRLDEFGLTEDDLRPYLEEKLLYDRMIALRFSQIINVSLKEIETYYNEKYVPAQRAQGQEPKPMIQVLGELESLIKEEKTSNQIASWITSLRDQAEVRINSNCLDHIK
jgi:hypothetical protein